MKTFALVLVSIICQACTTRDLDNTHSIPANSGTYLQNSDAGAPPDKAEVKKLSLKESQIDTYDLKNTLGLLGTKDRSPKKDEFIRIYNKDGSLWFEFSLHDAERTQQLIEENENFRPFRYQADADWFYFNCVGQDDRYYHVIVNDDSALIKFVKKDDPMLSLGTWEEYILNCFTVEFDSNHNPLHEAPNGKRSQTVDVSKSVYFHPEKIEGDWLKVRWHENNDDEQPAKFGWIKWKIDQKLVLGLAEIA